mgnify:CR=1 FL=1
MNMKLELLILALAVFTVGCMDNSQPVEPDVQNTSTPAVDSSGNITVYLTSSGFQPSEITIQEGETVTWINNASSPMWVASDQHPTHTNYADSTIYEHCQMGDQTEPAFDQCQSGERFTFTFEKAGEWNYHNHERAVQSGTITVK